MHYRARPPQRWGCPHPKKSLPIGVGLTSSGFLLHILSVCVLGDLGVLGVKNINSDAVKNLPHFFWGCGASPPLWLPNSVVHIPFLSSFAYSNILLLYLPI